MMTGFIFFFLFTLTVRAQEGVPLPQPPATMDQSTPNADLSAQPNQMPQPPQMAQPNQMPQPPQPVTGQNIPPGSLLTPEGTINEEGVLFQPTDGYVYDPNNRRDPFKPYGQSQSSQSPAIRPDEQIGGEPAPQLPPEPLQTYDVSQFKLMGIIWKVSTPKAVVKDPVGKQHIIYKNTKIGRNNGFVAAIREGEVLIVEPTVAENGMPSAITRVLDLKK